MRLARWGAGGIMTFQSAHITEGRKDDGGKLRYDLIPPDALTELVRVYSVGAARYGDRNWERGISFGRIFAALMRHAWAFWRGQENDPDDGIHHLAHAAWNCLTLLAYRLRGMTAFDDRLCSPVSPTWDDVAAVADAVKAIWEPQEWRLP